MDATTPIKCIHCGKKNQIPLNDLEGSDFFCKDCGEYIGHTNVTKVLETFKPDGDTIVSTGR